MQYQVISQEFIEAINYNRFHYPITSYLVFFQCFVHMTIAANRYTAISKPLVHLNVAPSQKLLVELGSL